MTEKPYHRVNRELWNAKTPYHLQSDFYDMSGFLAGRNTLHPIELECLGSVKDRKVLHLQCHFGQDSLSLARMGAQVTGVDFSDRAITEARRLNDTLGLDARFICGDVLDPDLPVEEDFDLVFTSYGVIGWLPELRSWGQRIARSLRPGGQFVMAEFHPVVWMFDGELQHVVYSYFNREVIVNQTEGTYADPSADIRLEEHTWNHALEEILSALLDAGLRLDIFREYDYSPYNIFPETVEVSGGYQIKGKAGMLPLVFALRATKK